MPGLFKKMLAKSSAGHILGSRDLELAKHFRVIRKLGQGGYSSVYEVKRLSDGEHYALKVTNIQELKPQVAHEVVQEIRLLASLYHPNLVQYHEAFVDHGKLCIVTELMPGGDLATSILLRYERMQRFSEGAIWGMFLQIAVAVQYLHHNHIMHRDLKPQNILVARDGSLKLADLGIAEILDRVFTETKSGTPHYMPPEFWRHARCSYSGDVWALGCVLHEICALRPLFLCASQRDMEDKMFGGQWERIPRRYSPELQRLVDTLLTVDPARRPTMDEVMQLPAVRQAIAAAPDFLRARCHSSGSLADDLVPRLFQPIAAPAHVDAPDEWEQLNEVLPPARYASGGSSVSDSLRAARQRRAASTGDLRALHRMELAREAATARARPGRARSCAPGLAPVLSMGLLRRRSTESIGRIGSAHSLASSSGNGSSTNDLLRPEGRAHSWDEVEMKRATGNMSVSASMNNLNLVYPPAGALTGGSPRAGALGHGSRASSFGSQGQLSNGGSDPCLAAKSPFAEAGAAPPEAGRVCFRLPAEERRPSATPPRPPLAGEMPDLAKLLGSAAGLGGVMAPHPQAQPLSSVLAAGRLKAASRVPAPVDAPRPPIRP
ncbi:hypothetical protein QBZ16_005182 [Prototheca wickerhamii]|uniref:non-specific serine/threonine protein kinase n=1 Tax=Prototheca wickerhamii TaxID=3111 RepID=A0AAD9IEP7_PROWI|nr:hypothetical protein QBZ16_005182 [Prototheca wickerhamii]